MGIPKFLGIDNTIAGFMRKGYPGELARERADSGCQWSAIPGREYCLNDCIKINFGRILEIALQEMQAQSNSPSVAELGNRFERHLSRAVVAMIAAMDFHLEHMHEVFPELVLSLLCHGPIEKGRDASHWGVEYYNLGLDGAALATVADSFAALEQRIEREANLNWTELYRHLEENWAGPEGERTGLMMRTTPRYGTGGSPADEWAQRIAQAFTRLVVETPTPGPFKMIPGLFSWAATILMGKDLGATPNGRRAGEPISHGANPDPGFRRDGAPTALALAIASVQPGYGNAAPMQIELDPLTACGEQAVKLVTDLIETHFSLSGTEININVLDRQRLLEAHQDPGKYPDLVVRVTGFSAYFASLSPEFRQLVVDRVLAAE
jgi:formate C-acetyltransferase